MYDHSGIALSLTRDRYPFNDRWDAGQLGFILVDRVKALKEYNAKILTNSLNFIATGWCIISLISQQILC